MNQLIKKASNSQTWKVDLLTKRILKTEMALNALIPTTLWISDLHGEGDRFVSILKGKFGMLFRTCQEALPKTLEPEKINYLGRVIRKNSYYYEPETPMDIQDVIQCLIKVLKYKINQVHERLDRLFSREYIAVFHQILYEDEAPDIVYENHYISQKIISQLSRAIKKSILNKIILLGDIFDRGPEPDKITRILSSKPYKEILHLIFGNHDILWMGACVGNQSLIAETMRITCRYDHIPLLDRLDFDIGKLKAFATKTYPKGKTLGKFKANSQDARSMEKALAIIQFKLEEKTIRNHPEYEMDSRLWLHKLATMLQDGSANELTDTYFPTLDFENPTNLTKEEQDVIDDLTRQFVTNSKLKRLIRFYFEEGKTYFVYNNFLNIHALIPSTFDGLFDTVFGYKGKKLLDFIQKNIEELGKNYIESKPQDERQVSLMFYLWSGPKSPFFGKNAMKTFERYFLNERETHKERSLYWDSNLKIKKFKDLIQKEFNVKRVIHGHTPRDTSKGQKIASEDGFAINVDGGFAKAYFNRGHSLVQTPKQIYGIILPTPDELVEAASKRKIAKIGVEIISDSNTPTRVKDTPDGKKLKEKYKQLFEELSKLNKNKFKSQFKN